MRRFFAPIAVVAAAALVAACGPDTVTKAKNLPPVAKAGNNVSTQAGQIVQFDGSASSDPDGTITKYAWDFGDNVTGTGVTAEHIYNAGGIYTVTLTVTDNLGATGSDTLTVAVGQNAPPTAVISAPSTGNVGQSLRFDGSGSTDSDGQVTAYDWDMGDGSTATGPKVDYAYTAAGSYVVTLTVTDDQGATGQATQAVTIAQPQGPIAVISGPATGNVGAGLTFDGSGSTDAGGQITTYAWDLGDNQSTTGASVTHAYTAAGTYTVTLTVTDDQGATANTTQVVTIGTSGGTDYSGTWSWANTDPSLTDEGAICGTFQSSTLQITSTPPTISITEIAGGSAVQTYTGTITGTDFDVTNNQLGIIQEIKASFTSPTSFTGFYHLDPAGLATCQDRLVVGTKQ